MDQHRASSDRRNEQRAPVAGRVQWRKESSDDTYRGWLSDRSEASLSFVAGTENRPTTGEWLEIMDSAGFRGRYRVTRVASYDGRLCVVACRSRSMTRADRIAAEEVEGRLSSPFGVG